MTTDDDVAALLREAAEELAARDAEDGVIRPGAIVICLVDVGNIDDSEPTMIRGVYGIDHEAAAEAFLRECERLEIPRTDIVLDMPAYHDFHRWGGTATVAVAPYTGAERGGQRDLSLIMGVLRG